ncbi:hypothetical protein BpHYR1_040366 [Brachionus plicatilis]|uniref:Uncharacterized protein n=1 Tax=Brachionus plicatilis TaxID=10195 RepID=A0A3M7QX95_BRAPC|nr:hypothetical protein BpHYR1_040366 [Brachionus plicatilis]
MTLRTKSKLRTNFGLNWTKYKKSRNQCSKTIRGGLDAIKVGDELVTDRKAIVGTMNNYFK